MPLPSFEDAGPVMAGQLRQVMTGLPCFSADLPGVGGILKTEPEHFQVEESLPYSPCGQGEHVYIRLKRAGWNTIAVASTLADCLGRKPAEIGWGGRKDKQAVATQTFSVRLPETMPLEQVRSELEALPHFEILSIDRHRNKIKTGHVAANHFDILLSNVSEDAGPRARAIAQVLLQRGAPNFFGEQRFGAQMRNIEKAVLLPHRGRAARGRPDPFMVSVLQSLMFNLWLAERIRRGDGHRILAGDVIRKCDTGGMFTTTDVEEVQARFEQQVVVYTGPVFGHKMRAAESAAGGYENEVLRAFNLQPEHFKPLRAAGSRRDGLLFLKELQVQPEETGLRFRFSLPSGAYATTVMREFMRTPTGNDRSLSP